MKITKLEVSNLKRIRLVKISPEGRSQIVSGANEQGKTTLLDSFAILVGGKKMAPTQPVRNGQARTTIDGTMEGDGVVIRLRRVFTAKGGDSFYMWQDGEKVKSGQKTLDALYNILCFDPLAFDRMKPAQQLSKVRELYRIDTSVIDSQITEAENRRLEIGRAGGTMKAEINAMTWTDGLPEEEISAASLMAEVEAENKRGIEKGNAANAVRAAQNQVDNLTTEQTRLQARAAELQKELDKVEADYNVAHRSCEDAKVKVKELQAKHDAMPDPSTGELTQRMAKVEEDNRAIRQNKRITAKRAEIHDLAAKYQESTAEVNRLRTERDEMVSKVQWPEPGMTMTETGIAVDGVPYDQMSSSRRIGLSAKIGMAAKPKMQVMLIRDGSLLDDEHQRILLQVAEEHGFQVLMEVVGEVDGEFPGVDVIQIHDGALAGDPTVIDLQPAEEAKPAPAKVAEEPAPKMSMSELQAAAAKAHDDKQRALEAEAKAAAKAAPAPAPEAPQAEDAFFGDPEETVQTETPAPGSDKTDDDDTDKDDGIPTF